MSNWATATFLWPTAFWLFALVAVLPVAYLWLLRRRHHALKFSNLELIRIAVGNSNLRRHVPPLLFFIAVVTMVIALARPSAVITLPAEGVTVMLAFDTGDLEPSRVEATKKAVKALLAEQPRGVRVGLVAFSNRGVNNGFVSQMPTLERDDVMVAMDHLVPHPWTALGPGLLSSLWAIFPDMAYLNRMSGYVQARRAPPPGARYAPDVPEPVPPGSYKTAIVVLMTDGTHNIGYPPVQAAHMAADRGVRVYTVGFSSPTIPLDELTLKEMAQITRGKYYNAKTGDELVDIYKKVSAEFVTETLLTELTAAAAALALVPLLLSGLLSLLWFNRMTFGPPLPQQGNRI